MAKFEGADRPWKIDGRSLQAPTADVPSSRAPGARSSSWHAGRQRGAWR